MLDEPYSGVDDRFFTHSYLALDVRSVFFTLAYSSLPLMNIPMPGMGTRYPSTSWDADGNYLSGENSYRPHLQPKPPAAFFWAATAYSPV